MKQLIRLMVLALLCLFSYAVHAQTFTETMDNIYQHLDKSPITSGILYDRVAPLAKVNTFNVIHPDTSNRGHFRQAYFEMYNAAYNSSGWITPDTMVRRANDLNNSGYAPMAIGLYAYHYIDINAVQNNQIYMGSDSLFYDVPNRSSSPYIYSTSILASPMVDSVFCNPLNQVNYNFANSLLINKSGLSITSLQVDFGNGSGLTTVNPGSNITVTYPPTMTGLKTLKFVMGLSNSATVTTYAQIKVITARQVTTNGLGGCTLGASNYYVQAEIPFQGYDESSPKYGTGLMTVYHSTNPCDGVVRKPIIIIDGFDPDGSNTAFYIRNRLNQPSASTGSTGLADYLQSLGYDIIILDFPNSGADYIERNAMTLVKALNIINTQLKSGYEKNIIIGPSMGGLISRYALAYMEQHNMSHQVKLYVSFDSPHLGANVPLGDQYFLDYLKDIDASAKENLNLQINSPAAKQMLLNHYQANSTTLAGAPNFRSTFVQALNNIGWPVGDSGQPFRKIAVTDGSLGGTLNTQPCGTAFGFEVNARTTINFLFHFSFENLNYMKADVNFTSNYGANCNVFHAAKFKFFAPHTFRYFTTASNTAGVDNAPGGYFDTQNQIASQGDGQNVYYGGIANFRTHFTSVFGTHSFINTKSALAFSGANQDLAENISNRSLVCTGETPFDSYYGDFGTNREHVTLWDGAIDYLLKEISGNPQLPPFTGGQVSTTINGPASFCSTTTYTISNLPSGSTVNWSVTGPATVSQSGNVAALSVVNYDHGYVTLTADVSSSCGHYTQTKTLYAGAFPIPDIYGFVNNGQLCGNSGYNAWVSPGYSTYEWTVSGGTIISGQNTPEVIYMTDPYSSPNQQMYITCHVYDECGRPIPESPIEYATITDCGGGGGISSRMSAYPNPANTTMTVAADNSQVSQATTNYTSLAKTNSTSFSKFTLPITNFRYAILDQYGKPLRSGESSNGQQINIDIRSITPGTYYLHMFVNKEVIKRQIIISH